MYFSNMTLHSVSSRERFLTRQTLEVIDAGVFGDMLLDAMSVIGGERTLRTLKHAAATLQEGGTTV